MSDSDNITPLISVGMPVYNGAKYLAIAIDSILVQTFTNFELIMIDDGSTDDTLNILRKYEQQDSRVRIVARENRGVATTRNDIIDIARGEWLAIMDSDDIALPHRFERQLAWLKETGADISGSWVQRFGSSDQRIIKLRQTNDAIRMEMLFGSPFAQPTVIMRTTLVRQLRYDSAWEKNHAHSHPAEDYDLWERAAEAGWKMTNVPEVLLKYRVHESQVSTASSMLQQQLAQQIRHRYWHYIFATMQLNQAWIEPVLKISEPSPDHIDMDSVDAALSELLQRSQGEARDAIFDHVTKLYFRVAANCPDVISRWEKLNQKFDKHSAFSTKARLWLLNRLRISPDSNVFILLRKLHIALMGNT